MKKTNQHIENEKQYIGLAVSEGIEQPPVINPYRRNPVRKQILSVDEYVQGIRESDISILSRAVTLVESSKPAHQEIAQQLIEKCLPFAGNAKRIGITGVPGAGKSSLIETLGMYLVNNGHKLAVLAIDPSSERSKGSILGDKTRMEELAASKNAFIRPSPSAGSLGGVARKTRETVVLCEAAGFDVVFIETVGVGQSEIAVHSMVDFFLFVQLAGTGDELQGIKRGIMEMADGIVINKADGNNVEKSKVARRQFQNALQLFPLPESEWSPQALTCSALEKTGIAELWDMIEDYITYVEKSGYLEKKRNEQAKYWMYESIDHYLKQQFYGNEEIQRMLAENEKKIRKQEITSFAAAKKLLEYFNSTCV